MARKKFSKLSAPKKTLLGMGTRRSAKAALNAQAGAHQKLIHGFLVRLEARSRHDAPLARAALVVGPNARLRALRPSQMKHEGPADDATFH